MSHRILLLFTAVILLVGCQETDENTLQFRTVIVDKTVRLSNEELSPMCSISLQMAYATEANGPRAEILNNTVIKLLLDQQDVSMQTAAEHFCNAYAENYRKHLLPLYNQDRADTTKRAWYQYHYIISTETHPGSKNTTVYVANIDYLEGSAHSFIRQQVMNFHTRTGRLLKLEDIFIDGYEKPLSDILLKALEEKKGATNLNDLRARGYLKGMDMYPASNFILDEETVTFIYNPSEIAPYDIGPTELTISYSQLEKILKNSFEY